jgi:hypothetical protein
MAGLSRSKSGVASARLCPAIHVFLASGGKDVDARHKAGMTRFEARRRRGAIESIARHRKINPVRRAALARRTGIFALGLFRTRFNETSKPVSQFGH